MSRTRASGSRLGLRREVLILLPVAVLLLVVLSTFSLLSYRSGLLRIADGQRSRTASLALQVAEDLSSGSLPGAAGLRRAAPGALGLALISADGKTRVATGDLAGEGLLAPLDGKPLTGPTGVGPNDRIPGRIAGFARFLSRGELIVLRVDFAADELGRQLGHLEVLLWVVLPLCLLVALLVMIFLRHMLAPYETLLAEARKVGERGAQEDEVSYLVNTFERAVASLTSGEADDGDAEIAAIQRALGPSLESGLLLLDRSGRILEVNTAGRELLGIQGDLGTTDLATTLHAAPELAGVLSQAVLEDRGVQRRELSLASTSPPRTLGLTVHVLRRDDGGARGFLALFVDLTEARRRADEERLSESLADLGELAAGVAHELRNSVATLKGYLTLIEKSAGEESIVDYLEELRRESDRLERVVTDFLDFARPETARIQDVDLERVIRKVAADPALAGVAIEISVAEGAEKSVRGDEQLLGRALRNLIQNAVQAGSPPKVHLSSEGSGILVSIDDRGPGLPPEVRQRLFQPFVTGRIDGVGLGLSIARRLIDLHGGRLEILDREEGGTSAQVWLDPGKFGT